MSTEATVNKQLQDFKPTENHNNLAWQKAKAKGKSGGTIVVKLVKCGKVCSGCPHGPYAYYVYRGGWTYLGKVATELETEEFEIESDDPERNEPVPEDGV
jgi:hypothetical protein